MSGCGWPARKISRPNLPSPWTQFLCVLLALAGLATGCKREKATHLSPGQIHQITQELAKAASDAAPNASTIRIRRARGSAGGAPDELRISLRGNEQIANKVRQAIDDVATRNRLTVDAETGSGNASQLTLRKGGIATHRLRIEMMETTHATEVEHPQAGEARLAILLDDLGSDRRAADAIFALKVPMTLSVLPFHEHSREIAQEARRHGCEVLLHLPMQSVGNETPEAEELRPGLSADDVENLVNKMLEAVPEADGVNNHQGSQATANGTLMDELMAVLRDAGVFYVDSRTTAATVAYETARRSGVKTGFRNVPFLDDVRNDAAIKRQLQLAIRGAKEKKEAIAIGHPHPETLQALREMLPEARKQGVRLVLVSDVVH